MAVQLLSTSPPVQSAHIPEKKIVLLLRRMYRKIVSSLKSKGCVDTAQKHVLTVSNMTGWDSIMYLEVRNQKMKMRPQFSASPHSAWPVQTSPQVLVPSESHQVEQSWEPMTGMSSERDQCLLLF